MSCALEAAAWRQRACQRSASPSSVPQCACSAATLPPIFCTSSRIARACAPPSSVHCYRSHQCTALIIAPLSTVHRSHQRSMHCIVSNAMQPTAGFMVHHIHASTIHATVLILLKGCRRFAEQVALLAMHRPSLGGVALHGCKAPHSTAGVQTEGCPMACPISTWLKPKRHCPLYTGLFCFLVSG